MKVKNEYIKIKQGKNEITLNNYIYDSYLSLFSTTQYNVSEERIQDLNDEQLKKRLDNCYLKFDTPLDDITDASLSDFDVEMHSRRSSFNNFKNGVDISYDYKFDNYAFINGTFDYIDVSDYYGKKITALGFSSYLRPEIVACIDVSNYEIYVLENENLTITRKDSIKSDAIINGYNFPVHLSPVGDPTNAYYNNVTQEFENKYAKLYSIGLSKTLGIIDEEYVIGDDIDIKVIDDTSFSFNLKKGENVSIYPNNNLYAGANIFPLPLYIAHENYPNINIYPDNNLFPTDSNYKFIVYKFQLYRLHWAGQPIQAVYLTLQELDEYYEMYLENNTKGLFEIITKIERS